MFLKKLFFKSIYDLNLLDLQQNVLDPERLFLNHNIKKNYQFKKNIIDIQHHSKKMNTYKC